MPVMSATERARAAAAYMRERSGESMPFTKAQLVAAVAAADDWVEANTAAFNAALPAAFRTSSTVAQKIALLGFVLMRRIGRLRVTEDD